MIKWGFLMSTCLFACLFCGGIVCLKCWLCSHWFSPLLCSSLVLLINSCAWELAFNLGGLNVPRSKACLCCFPIRLLHLSLFKRYFQYSQCARCHPLCFIPPHGVMCSLLQLQDECCCSLAPCGNRENSSAFCSVGFFLFLGEGVGRGGWELV